MTYEDGELLQHVYRLLGQALSDAQDVLERQEEILNRHALQEVGQRLIVKHLKEAVDNMELAHGELTALFVGERKAAGFDIETR